MKYSKISKDEKRKVKEKYKNKYGGSEFNNRLIRLLIYAIVAYAFSISLIIYTLVSQEDLVSNLLIAIPLFLAATIFLVGRWYVKSKVLEKLANKKS